MLQGKFGALEEGNYNNPILAITDNSNNQATLACKCASGYEVAIVNNVAGGGAHCSCVPSNDHVNVNSALAAQCAAKIAPKGYRYYSNGEECIMGVDYEANQGVLMTLGTQNVRTGFNPNPAYKLAEQSLLEKAKAFVIENKIAVGIGALFVGYFAFASGGLAAESRTVTSVSRFAPRKKNGVKRRSNFRKKR